MIISFENGRVGNQLFQYAALKELFLNHRLVLLGYKELEQALESIDAIVIEKDKLPQILLLFFYYVLIILSNLRIIGTIEESRKKSIYVVNKSRGLFSIYLMKSSFFQHSYILNIVKPDFELNKSHISDASEWLCGNVKNLNDSNLVFVNIRRGDYLNWPNPEYPAVLDKHWYIMAMDQMREKVKNPIFLLLTDDLYYAKDCFGDQLDIMISENDQLVDLALMSQCKHGILSASTFAWWGAWFSKEHSVNEGTYLAPKYWCGHRIKEWKPEGFITNWITYI